MPEPADLVYELLANVALAKTNEMWRDHYFLQDYAPNCS